MTLVTAFHGHSKISAGPLAETAIAVKALFKQDPNAAVLIFDDETGKVVDVDLRGSEQEIRARYAPPEDSRGRGRPKLGVVPREVTLLPRHWDWLNAQPGGASVALRKLVEAARKTGGDADNAREKRDAAYRFMSAIAGDFPHFEEVSRALFAGDMARLHQLMQSWPQDITAQIVKMLTVESGA